MLQNDQCYLHNSEHCTVLFYVPCVIKFTYEWSPGSRAPLTRTPNSQITFLANGIWDSETPLRYSWAWANDYRGPIKGYTGSMGPIKYTRRDVVRRRIKPAVDGGNTLEMRRSPYSNKRYILIASDERVLRIGSRRFATEIVSLQTHNSVPDSQAFYIVCALAV